jgi:hypothetical protein
MLESRSKPQVNSLEMVDAILRGKDHLEGLVFFFRERNLEQY